jgi:hypothetical protein
MITTDALKYLPQMGLDPSWVVGCAGTKCQNSFALANGFAVEAIVAENVRSSSSVRLAAISTRSHRTVLRGRDETAASLQASSLRSLWRTIRHGDPSLVGQQVLQKGVQRSIRS